MKAQSGVLEDTSKVDRIMIFSGAKKTFKDLANIENIEFLDKLF